MTSNHPLPNSKRLIIYFAEVYCTLMQQLRQPLGALVNLFWPIPMYLFFAFVISDNLLTLMADFHGAPANLYLLAVSAMIGTVTVAFNSFGLSLALERARGWLRLRRASPAPVSVYLASRLTTALLFGLALTIVMLLAGVLFADLTLTLTQALGLVVALVVGVLPFAALALALTYLVAPGSAAAVILWSYYLLIIPLMTGPIAPAWPSWAQWLFEQLPTYHLAQIVFGTIGWPQAALWPSYLSLGLFTLIALAVAAWSYRREEKSYG